MHLPSNCNSFLDTKQFILANVAKSSQLQKCQLFLAKSKQTNKQGYQKQTNKQITDQKILKVSYLKRTNHSTMHLPSNCNSFLDTKQFILANVAKSSQLQKCQLFLAKSKQTNKQARLSKTNKQVIKRPTKLFEKKRDWLLMSLYGVALVKM